MTSIFTIGHSTRSTEEFLGLLARNDVRLLVDVRRFPGSRRHPQFGSETLAGTLGEAGIGYRHEPDLGGRRAGGRGAGAESANGGWRNASFRAYADHLASPEFRAALDRVRADTAAGPVAIMCAEAVPWRCHRQLIADVLVAGGADVRHIISEAEPQPHALNPMARIGEGGQVTYPAPEPEQRRLL